MLIKKIKIEDIIPYENNPRENDGAVDVVAKSIQQCEYISPIIVDENNVILAGHTRYKALKKLGYSEIECVVKSGLSEEQKKKYRLLDNKTNELADWNFDLLAEELTGLDFGDLELDWGLSSSGDENDSENPYTKKVNIPQYDVKGKSPSIVDLCQMAKVEQLINGINDSSVSEDEKEFLRIAAYRHAVINFENVAEYYANASVEMQKLMEDSALVIIDYDDAIANGFTALTEALDELKDEEYGDS